jgi:hypothetical protein
LNYEEDDIISKQILEFYFGKNKDTFTREGDYQLLTDMYSDRYFFGCTRREKSLDTLFLNYLRLFEIKVCSLFMFTGEAAKFHSMNSPTYLYFMKYQSGMSFGHGISCSKGRFPVILELLFTYVKENFYKNILGWPVHDYGKLRNRKLFQIKRKSMKLKLETVF